MATVTFECAPRRLCVRICALSDWDASSGALWKYYAEAHDCDDGVWP